MLNGISQGTGNSLFGVLRTRQKEQAELPNESINELPAAQTVSTPAASSNLMSRNFVSAEREESKYLKARKAGQEAVNNQANRQMAILNAGLAELSSLDGSGGYAMRSLIGQKTARRIQEEGQQAVREESERNLKEIKDNIEEKTQEAVAPKDENGEPIEKGTTAGSAEATPIPEISVSNQAPAPAPDVSEALPPNTAQAVTPTPEISIPSAPPIQSIDLIV